MNPGVLCVCECLVCEMFVYSVLECVYCLAINDVLGELVPVAYGLWEVRVLVGVCVRVVCLVFM